MSSVKLFVVLTLIALVGIVTSFTIQQKDAASSSNGNCTACETIYNLALKNVKPEYIGNETSARSYMLGECNYFRQVGTGFWPFCFEMYTQNFNAFWQDLKVQSDPMQACKALGICQ
uniref:Saposin B-type domain-containing protein n=1 Tax=Panagrolaimus sp. ES5 TaxID=591445 RepID=A0AC34G9U0_9BILA